MFTMNGEREFMQMIGKTFGVLLGAGLMLVASFRAGALEVVAAEYKQVAQERIFDGVVEAINRSTVSAQLVSRIVEINYDVDDLVPKGAVLLRFRDSEQRARLNQAKAGLKEARARFTEATDEYARVKDIYAKKLVSKAGLDKAEAELKAARARLEAAKARLAEAQEQLDHTVIKAPFAGLVTKRHVEVGETVGIGQPLMTGLSLEQLRATTHIPQAFVGAVREKGRARVIIGEGRSIGAESLRVFPYADERSHAFKVRVNLPEGVEGLYPGSFVKVAFVTGEEQRLLVPEEAVVRRSELTALYVVEADGNIHFRQIRAGRLIDGLVEVLAGVDAGEQIALDPIAAGIELKQQGR